MKYDINKIDTRASHTEPVKYNGKDYLTVSKIAHILDRSKGTVYNYIVYYKPDLDNYFIRLPVTLKRKYPMGTRLMPVGAFGKFLEEFLGMREASFVTVGDELEDK